MNDIIQKLWAYDWEKIPNSRSDMTRKDMDNLETLCQMVKKPNMLLCDVGCKVGSSSAVLASYVKITSGKLYAFDWYKTNPDAEIVFKSNLKNLGLYQYIDHQKISSIEASQIFDFEFDLIFIDADHEYANIKQDIELWYPKLKKGGILCGHDCEVLSNKEGEINIKQISMPVWNTFTAMTFITHALGRLSVINHCFNLKNIPNWEKLDIIGLNPNGREDLPQSSKLGIHPGVIMAVSEIFGDKAQIKGDRVWWIRK